MSVKIEEEFCESDRYTYDNLLCSKGFAQIDSKEDASYYGHWACPVHYIIFSYVEGDCTTTKCDTADEFVTEIRKLCDWMKSHDQFVGIDPGIRSGPDEWKELGLGDLLH